MIAIDQLLHSFHWDQKAEAPNRLAANNLIDGNHEQVLRLLKDLSAGGRPDWRSQVKVMKRSRRGRT